MRGGRVDVVCGVQGDGCVGDGGAGQPADALLREGSEVLETWIGRSERVYQLEDRVEVIGEGLVLL